MTVEAREERMNERMQLATERILLFYSLARLHPLPRSAH